jgi:hypothetical protein
MDKGSGRSSWLFEPGLGNILIGLLNTLLVSLTGIVHIHDLALDFWLLVLYSK